MSAAPAPGRFLIIVIGLVLILAAGILVALASLPRQRAKVDSAKEAVTACRDFEDVYGATQPGSPLNGQALASKLGEAIDHMHKAASGNPKWKSLASSLDDLGSAVNAGDAPGSYSLMQNVHQGCSSVIGTGNA